MVSETKKFKVGDRVKRIAGSKIDGMDIGDSGIVSAAFCEWIGIDEFPADNGDITPFHQGNFELVWQPKIGDRVRMIKDGRSTKGAAGKTATISSWSGKLVDEGEYLLDIDPPVNYETAAFTQNFTRATIDCFEPLPTATEARHFTIEAGKFYKTRDGRKVGPAFVTGSTTTFGEKGNWSSAVWTDTGRQSTRDDTTTELANDIIAEWVDKPAVAVAASNDNAAPAKFKVGDFVKITATDWPECIGIGEVLKVVKVDDDGFYPLSRFGHDYQYFYFSEGVLVTPASSPTAIVALIENGQPKRATRPFVHTTEEAARKEADRLSGVHKGQQFGVYVLTTTSQESAPVYKHGWQRLAAKGEKIAAIKELRDQASLTLKGAKDAVEHWLATAA